MTTILDSALMMNTSGQAADLRDQYGVNKTEFLTISQNMATQDYVSADSAEILRTIMSFKQVLDEMEATMDQYSTFFHDSSVDTDTTTGDIIGMARRGIN